MGCDEGMNQDFSSREGERWAEMSNVAEVKKGESVLKGEVIIKDDSEVVDVRGGRLRRVIAGEREGLGNFGD